MSIDDSNYHDAPHRWGELSVFQQVMRQWDDLHPYNAVHVFRLEGQADIEKLSAVIERTWQALDFGMVEIRKDRYRFSWSEEHRPEIEVISPGQDPTETLNAHLADCLNFRFPTQDYCPIRFSVMQESTCHHVCVTYHHWIGDGMAIRVLMQPVIEEYCRGEGEAVSDAARKISFYPPTYRKTYQNYFSKKTKRFGQWYRGILANNVTIQMPSDEKNNMHAEYLSQEFSDETLKNMSAYAKQLGVTVHDLFLAAITRACMPHLPERLVRRKRRQMGIGSIVNTRGMADMEVDHMVGIFLGYFITHTRADRASTFGELAQAISEKTRVSKEKSTYLNTAIGMKIQCSLWPMMPQFAKAGFLRNSMPLSAGITNSYVKDPWMISLRDASPRRLLSYFRAAPTGPIIPISFAPTTMADSLHLGITWRPSCFDRKTVEAIASDMKADLLSVAESG